MAHGGYGKRRVAGRKPSGSGGSSHRSKGLGVSKKPKTVSIKNQIRSIERILHKVCIPNSIWCSNGVAPLYTGYN
ncbi:hypothetical protein Dimus_022412 [Dionaea muscipula]